MKTINNTELKEDVEFLEKKLLEIHPNPFKYLKKEDFFAYTRELKNTKKTMSIYEFGMKLMILLARIRDGHIEMGYSDDVQGPLSCPVRFEYITDGYYVVGASKEYKELLGAKLLFINDYSMGEVEKMLLPIITIENEVSLRYYLAKKLEEPRVLNYFGVTNGDHYILELEKDSKVTTVEMTAIHHNDVNLIHINETIKELDWTLLKKDTYWIKDLPDLDAVYFQYNECEEIEGYKMSEVVGGIKRYNRKRLIIDLRDNIGGNSDVLNPLIRYIKKNKGISVYVLVGVKTYSSAIYNLVQLSRLDNVVTLGEIPHGNPTHYGEPDGFRLPNSRIEVFSSTRTFTFKGYRLGESFKPNYLVSPVAHELLKGKDSQFKYLTDYLLQMN